MNRSLLIILSIATTFCENSGNGPQLRIPPCLLNEHVLYDFEHYQCNYTVIDYHGQLGSIEFTFEKPECQDTFELRFKSEPDDKELSSEMVLVTKKELDYDVTDLYICNISMKDVAGLTNTFIIPVEVYRFPTWTSFPRVKHIKEKEDIQFTVSAEVVNHPNVEVGYRLIDEYGYYLQQIDRCIGEYMYSIKINPQYGDIRVSPIDRDRGVNNFTIDVMSFADIYMYKNTREHILVLVEDIDDHIATIQTTEFKEIFIQQNATKVTIHIQANDLDEGLNAAYFAVLTTPEEVKDAFVVSPQRGQGSTEFTIIVYQNKLDFDDPKLVHFNIKFETVGVKNSSHVDSLTLPVYLSKYKSAGGMITNTIWIIFLSVLISILRTEKIQM